MIDPTDLRVMKASEFKIGGTYYLKEGNVFYRCIIYQEDLKDPLYALFLKTETERFAKEQRLFVRINKPFQSFV